MHGRLRLDKLASYIERFLEQEQAKKEKTMQVVETGSSSGHSECSKSKAELSGTVYYRPSPCSNEPGSPRDIQDEIDSAIPFTEILASGNKTANSFLFHVSIPFSRYKGILACLPSFCLLLKQRSFLAAPPHGDNWNPSFLSPRGKIWKKRQM